VPASVNPDGIIALSPTRIAKASLSVAVVNVIVPDPDEETPVGDSELSTKTFG